MSDPRIGSLIADRFEIERLAGQGGMGVVYRARDRATGEPVAVKLMPGRPDGSVSGARFAREAAVLSRLRHPAIVAHIASGSTPEGSSYLAMEWLDGEDLSQRLERGPLSLRETLALGRRVLDALAEAHGRGVIHRDLKPSNLFLRDGSPDNVVLLDFGIARRLEGTRALTRTGQQMGTPQYMAPEQVRGDRAVGAAADFFSLGCVLFECIAGTPPFASEHVAAVFTKILLDDPPALESLRAGVPSALAGLVARMMAKRPEDRAASAEALRGEIAAIEVSATDERAASDGALRVNPAALTRAERQIVGIILATDARDGAELARTVDADRSRAERPHEARVSSALAVLGTEVTWLPDGTLVATVTSSETATDLAVRAARSALLAKDLWPEARVSLCLCRAVLGDKGTFDAGIERAARRLVERDTGGDDGPATSEGVWIDELSAGLLDGRFEVSEIRGGLRLRAERAELDASRSLLGKPTPCVGREQDLAQLELIWNTSVHESTASVVVVTGAAGVGKSRLRHELLRRLTASTPGLSVLAAYGNAMNAGSPYGLLRHALRSLCGVRGNEAITEQRARLTSRLSLHVPPEELQRACEFLGELCGVPFDDESSPGLRAARRDPKVMADQVSHAFLTFLRAECRAHPVLLVLEDLQWGDALTVRLLDTALRELADEPWMLFALARPELDDAFPRLWAERDIRQIRLGGLHRKAAERLVREVLGASVGSITIDRLVKQSQGNALFLEELVRARAEGKGDAPPETVLAILEGRIARLDPEARRILRAAALFGERFWRGGVIALLGSQYSTQQVDPWLAQLVDAEVLTRSPESRFRGEVEYAFRHALMRDAAYGLSIDQDRARGHAAAAEYLLALGEDDPIVLAEHFRLGQNTARAAEYYLRAARESYQRCDLDATEARVTAGLACAPAGDVSGGLLHLRLAVQFSREQYASVVADGPAAIARLAPGTAPWCLAVANLLVSATLTARFDVFGAWMPVFAAATPVDEAASAAYCEGAVWLQVLFSIQAQREPARMWMQRVLTVGEAAGADNPAMRTYVATSRASYHELVEDLPEARVQFNREAADGFHGIQDERHACMMQCYLYKCLAEVGEHDAAEQGFRETLALSERLREPMLLGYARTYLARHLAATDDPAKWDEAATLALDVTRMANPTMVGLAHATLAAVALRRGDLERAVHEATVATETLQPFLSYRFDVSALRIDALVAAGRAAEAAEFAAREVATMEQTGTSGYGETALRRAAVQAMLAAGATDAARAMLVAAEAALQSRAATITAPARRESYLQRVPDHARIAALRASLGA